MTGRTHRLALALLAISCETPAEKPTPRLWTVFDFAAALGNKPTLAKGASAQLPEGFAPQDFLSAPGQVRVSPGFSESRTAAFVTTELWANFPEVWLQPMYILVTQFNDETHAYVPLPNAKAVFSVGPASAFYSPFWRVFYALVPPGTPPDQYQSARQVLNAGLPLRQGPNRLCVLVPPQTTLGPQPVVRPFFGDEIGAVGIGAGWIDGTSIAVLDFGINRFTANAQLEIDAQPLFVFVVKKQGLPRAAHLPAVGGTGALFSTTVATAPRNRPIFGSLWRIHTVSLPRTAGVFIPAGDAFTALRTRVEDQGISVLPLPARVTDPATINALIGRVALNAVASPGGTSCFGEATFPDTCQWLDSQAAIEGYLPAAIERTELLLTSPFVTYADAPVPLQ